MAGFDRILSGIPEMDKALEKKPHSSSAFM